MSLARVGRGTVIAYSADNVTFTPLAEVLDITGPEFDLAQIEVTNQDSPAGFREFIPGIADPGTLSFDLNYIKTTMTSVANLRGVNRYWKVTFNDNSVWAGQGFINKHGQMTPHSEVMAIRVEIKCSGSWSFSAG